MLHAYLLRSFSQIRLIVNGIKVQILNLNAYSSYSGGRLHNHRVINTEGWEQKPSLESYLCNIIICNGHRWVMAALQGGCLPLHVEVGRYRTPKTPYHLRTCNLCINSVETEFHFVMECPALQDLRSSLFDCLSYLDNPFTPSPKLRSLSISFVQIIIEA